MRCTRRDAARWLLAGVSGLALARTLSAEESGPRKIAVTAKKFQFVPNPIVLQKGEAVVLEITALDFTHGLNIPDLKFRTDLLPGRVTRVPLRFDQAGEVEFLCDNFCGDEHEQMHGKIVVQG